MGLNASHREEKKPNRIGVFGGTFDPIHRGHMEIARFALQHGNLDELLMVPAGRPWLRGTPPVASPEHRLRMTELAVDGEPGIAVSDVDVVREGETYSIDTLVDLRTQYGAAVTLVLVLGADSALSMDRWHRAQELPGLCEVLVIGRPGEIWNENMPSSHPAHGAKFLDGPMMDISATSLRERLARGDDVRDSLAATVFDYIRQHGLYGTRREDSQMVQTGTGAERLLERAKELGALEFGDFTLTSGQKSKYYFDGRRLSLDPEGSDIISKLFLDAIRDAGCEAVGGPTVAAVPIVGSLVLRAWQEKANITGYFVRPEKKGYGMGRQIEGSVKPGMKVAVFDDTVSTGGSLLQAIDAVQEFGCEVAAVLCVLDRKQGGSDEVKRRGLPFISFWEATPEGDVQIVRR
ncbi:MAG: nicotinate-nucleotide adenylyltransferase [Chloroflexi bacterium]|nr:nicotinate-nucleotide adenylyltransferase [Chloroflexota bacterium]